MSMILQLQELFFIEDMFVHNIGLYPNPGK